MTGPFIPGDPVPLGTFLAHVHAFGVVGTGDTPAMQVATLELVDQNAVLALDALKGDKGDKGEPADIVKLQYDSDIDDPADLPTNLTNTPADIGKAWWIGSVVYMWTGTQFVFRQMGSEGRPGPVPNITIQTELIPETETSSVVQTGSALNPVVLFRIAAPRGPIGPAASYLAATDYVGTTPPEDGQTLTWDATNNGARFSDFAAKHPRFYSMPEANFVNFTGMAQRQNIGSFVIEAQDYDYVPYVAGHIKAWGVELDADPLIIGVEVRLNDPISGTLIGRGFGNISNWATITPHFSTTGDPTAAVAPDNGVAQVSAGQQATIHVNLYNDGLLGAYIFNKAGAQLSVLTVPQG